MVEVMNVGNLDMTRLYELVRDHPDFEVLCEPMRDPYYFRYVPNTFAEEEYEIPEELDRLNEEIVESVQRSGLNSVMTTRVRGRVAIQIANSSNGIVEATFEVIARWGRWLNNKRSLSHQTTPDMEAE